MTMIDRFLDEGHPALRVAGRLFFPLLLFWAFWHHSMWALAASVAGLFACWFPFSEPRSILNLAQWSIHGHWKGMTNGQPTVRIATLISGFMVVAVTLWALWQHQAAIALAGATIIMVVKTSIIWRLETVAEAGLVRALSA